MRRVSRHDHEDVRPVPRAGEIGAAVAVDDGERRQRGRHGQRRGGHAQLAGRAASPARGARDAGASSAQRARGIATGQRIDEEPRHVGREEGHGVQERRDDGQGHDVDRDRADRRRGRAQRAEHGQRRDPGQQRRPATTRGTSRGTGAGRGGTSPARRREAGAGGAASTTTAARARCPGPPRTAPPPSARAASIGPRADHEGDRHQQDEELLGQRPQHRDQAQRARGRRRIAGRGGAPPPAGRPPARRGTRSAGIPRPGAGARTARRRAPPPAARGRARGGRGTAAPPAASSAAKVTMRKARAMFRTGMADASHGVRMRWPQGATVKNRGCSAIAT